MVLVHLNGTLARLPAAKLYNFFRCDSFLWPLKNLSFNANRELGSSPELLDPIPAKVYQITVTDEQILAAGIRLPNSYFTGIVKAS